MCEMDAGTQGLQSPEPLDPTLRLLVQSWIAPSIPGGKGAPTHEDQAAGPAEDHLLSHGQADSAQATRDQVAGVRTPTSHCGKGSLHGSAEAGDVCLPRVEGELVLTDVFRDGQEKLFRSLLQRRGGIQIDQMNAQRRVFLPERPTQSPRTRSATSSSGWASRT